ncbi:MAG: SufD family Fe-S cluster assembly protein [Pseudomonadales bacterium]
MADRLTPAELIDALPVAPDAGPAAAAWKSRTLAAVAQPACREHWKYSPLAEFIHPLSAQSVARPVLRGLNQPGLRLDVRAAGRDPSAGEDPADAASTARFPLADLGRALTGELQVLHIEGSPASPVEVDLGDGIGVPLLIEVAGGARVTLLERNTAEHFGHHSVYLHLHPGSRVTHARTALHEHACDWSLNQVVLSADSHYELQQYTSGGKKRRTETHVILQGAAAQAHLIGAYVVGSGAHLDQQFILEHRARDTLSRQRFHGIGAGKGTAVFNGRIHIHPDSPRCDATLSNRNLALHPDAQINTKPELEIYTDDVKCAHGATVGRISGDSLFYLQSRGLRESEARRMLCRAFIRECVTGPLAEEAAARLLTDWWTDSHQVMS